jgi:hypothetical protein
MFFYRLRPPEELLELDLLPEERELLEEPLE